MKNFYHLWTPDNHQILFTCEADFKMAMNIIALSGFECRLRVLETAVDVRNVLSYNNRNGFLVSPDETPFSYRWGAGRWTDTPAP